MFNFGDVFWHYVPEVDVLGIVYQGLYILRRSAIGTSYGDWHCSGAVYVVACTKE